MKSITGSLLAVVSIAACASSALAQTLPTTQPNYLQIYREEVKVGHDADHAKVEAGWPAAYEKAKSPYTYIALASMTGPAEAWFVQPFQSHEAMGDAMQRDDEPGLAASLAQLRRADADQINGARSILASARKDLSHGAFPDSAKQRFYEITIFRVRPGHVRDFEAAAKAYGAAADRAAPGLSYRVYEVMAGMPSPTYLVFSSVTAYAGFDKAVADDQAIGKAFTAEEQETLQKFSAEGLVNTETIRFRLDPRMSYVPPEVRAQDPSFWKQGQVPALARAGSKPASKAAPKVDATR
ncbi:MAG: hypothetical protein H6Q10_3670 [Acidobacteria bacterium]|nr:hypothetical protein [Acidobacteriota bacterium]